MNMIQFSMDFQVSNKQSLRTNIDSSKSRDDFSKVLDQTKGRDRLEDKSDSIKTSNTNKQVSKDKQNDLRQKDSSRIKTDTVKKEVTNLEEEKLKTSEKLASILGIDLSQLEDLLNKLQITIADLLDKDVLQQFLIEVHNLEDSSELLLVSQVSRQFKEITELLETNKEKIKGMAKLVTIKEDFAEIYKSNKNQDNEKIEDKVENNQATLLDSDGGKETVAGENLLRDKETGLSNREAYQAKEVPVAREEVELGESSDTSEGFNLNSKENQFFETLTQTMGEVLESNQDYQVTIDKELAKTQQVDPREVIDRIIDKIKVDTSDLESQIKIDLKPEHLGKLSMEFISKEGNLTANFMVESERVKMMIEQNIQQLKNALKSQDIIIQELEVTVGENPQDFSGEQGKRENKYNKRLLKQIDELMGQEERAQESLEEEIYNNEVNLMA